MTRNDEVIAAWALVDTATTELAARIQLLIDEINNTAELGLDGPQTDAVLANLGNLVTTLTAMGSNSNSPIPSNLAHVRIPGQLK